MAGERGYHALAANRTWSLRKRSDYRIAKYAIDRDLILVTNDFFDLASVYEQFEFHPGLVFLTAATSKLRDLVYLKSMFAVALDAIEEEEPIQQAIYIRARRGPDRSVSIDIDRYYLPHLK